MSAATAHDTSADSAAELRRFLSVFAGGTERLVTEVRALEVPQRYGTPVSLFGFFDLPNPKPLWDALVPLLRADPADQPEGVYVVLNPVSLGLLARASNRLKRAGKKAGSATDKDVTARRWLVVDVDPVRPVGVSATDEEKGSAWEVAGAVRDDLASRGWPAPMVIVSGNGFHLWYRIDLPADDGGLVERCLKALAARHDTPQATVDTSCFNPSRLVKLPGTYARKGDSTADRPHRMARVLEVPQQ